jgi:hypothetical protein
MFLGHTAGWWGIALGIAAIVLMVPVGLLVNMLTPSVQNWIATWGYSSLTKRIGKLERKLSELEKFPTITEVEDRLLWGIEAIRISVLSAASGVILVVLVGVQTLGIGHVNNLVMGSFQGVATLVILSNLINTLTMRYRKGFRHARSPAVRESLRKSIASLKEIQANWGNRL